MAGPRLFKNDGGHAILSRGAVLGPGYCAVYLLSRDAGKGRHSVVDSPKVEFHVT